MARLFFFLFFALTHSAFAQPCQLLLLEERASLQSCAGVHILRLKGSPVERASKLGELLKRGVISNEVINYFSEKVSHLAHENAGWFGGPITLAYHQLVRLLHRAAPASLSYELDAMSKSMGIDPILLRRGISLPDTATLIQGLGSFPSLDFLPTMGCSSVSARLENGGFAYGRNLDFASVGIWDKHPMLLVAEPESGSGELRHLVIGADGVAFGGITGVNEAGLTFALHQNFSRDISLSGVPVIYLGELVLRNASTLEQAVEILRKHRPASQWTFVLTNLKNGESIAVESSPHIFLIRRNEGRFFVQTNHSMHEETRSKENFSFGVKSNSIFRMKQTSAILEKEAKGAASLARVLGYQSDPEGRLSAYHDILKAETIQTAIFESRPEKATRLFLSIDAAPSSSGRFATFLLNDLWKPIGPESVELESLHPVSEQTRKNQLAVTEAYRLYFEEHRIPEALAALKDQRSFNAFLFRSIALLEDGRPAESLREAETALHEPRFLGEPEYIRLSFERVRLVSLLQSGKWTEAQNLAAAVLERENEKNPASQPVIDLAKMILQKERIPRGMLNLHFEFFSGDIGGRTH